MFTERKALITFICMVSRDSVISIVVRLWGRPWICGSTLGRGKDFTCVHNVHNDPGSHPHIATMMSFRDLSLHGEAEDNPLHLVWPNIFTFLYAFTEGHLEISLHVSCTFRYSVDCIESSVLVVRLTGLIIIGLYSFHNVLFAVCSAESPVDGSPLLASLMLQCL